MENKLGEWVRFEVFGHRCHYGRLTEVERFGAKLARIEVYCVDGHFMAELTYSGAAIFSLSPVLEEVARKQTGTHGCTHASHRVVAPPALDAPMDPDEICACFCQCTIYVEGGGVCAHCLDGNHG